ncbi:hypothetical protein BDFB_011467 [Asbolus verrucosus]|uniref:Uncharacterized protein n=1 Tax=Asbolus verrucosus TaxID=1661398 RepID=A0A482W047_ASBVE|nr:hypothetical protein BDFB_011467 [Asbolus verrucosus]
MLRVCEILAEQEELRVATNETFKGACCAFAGAVVGGLLGGPVGLGVGSAAGGAVAAYRSKGKFKSVVHIIANEMPETEKQRLAEAVNNVVRSIDATDVIALITMINANNMLKSAVLKIIKDCVTQDMGLTLV